MSEKQFQAQVIHIAKQLGWIHFHCYDARRSPEGYPDLTLVRDRVLFRELKTEKGRLTPSQKHWGERLTASGADYELWRPSDMPRILKTLKGRTK